MSEGLERQKRPTRLPKNIAEFEESLNQARLEGANIVRATVGHYLGNEFGIVFGNLELIAGSPDLSPELKKITEVALEAAESARRTFYLLGRLRRLVTLENPGGQDTLDLDKSAQ